MQPGFPGTLPYQVTVGTPSGITDSVSSNNVDSVTLYHDPTAVSVRSFTAHAETLWDRLFAWLGWR